MELPQRGRRRRRRGRHLLFDGPLGPRPRRRARDARHHPAVALHQRDAVEPPHADARVRAPAQLAELGADRVRARRFVHDRRRAPRPRRGQLARHRWPPRSAPSSGATCCRRPTRPSPSARSCRSTACADVTAKPAATAAPSSQARVEIGLRRFADHRHRRLRQPPLQSGGDHLDRADRAGRVVVAVHVHAERDAPPSTRGTGSRSGRRSASTRPTCSPRFAGRAEQVAVGGEHVVRSGLRARRRSTTSTPSICGSVAPACTAPNIACTAGDVVWWTCSSVAIGRADYARSAGTLARSDERRRRAAARLPGRRHSPCSRSRCGPGPSSRLYFASWPLLLAQQHGDGHSVLVLPPFGATDAYTSPLRVALRGLGYSTHGWELGQNLGPTSSILEGVPARLQELADRSGRPVSVIGWSAGGILGREAGAPQPRRGASGHHARVTVPAAHRRPLPHARRVLLQARRAVARAAHRRDPVVGVQRPAARGARHRDLQPHRRRRELAVVPRGRRAARGEHRGVRQPLRARAQPGRAGRDRRPPRATRGRVEAVHAPRALRHLFPQH